FHSGLRVACIAGAGVAVLGALAAFRLLPGRHAEAVPVGAVAAGDTDEVPCGNSGELSLVAS
ncbi:MAG TPA: hypothetical protein VIX84_04245, partial [Acidimicrobiales bacterium]